MYNSIKKQETTTALIESLNNGPENYLLIDEGDISNYLIFDIKKNSDGAFKLSKSHLVEKIINHVVLTVSLSLKERETPSGKPLLHKDESSLEKRYTCNCGDEVGMLSYLQGLT